MVRRMLLLFSFVLFIPVLYSCSNDSPEGKTESTLIEAQVVAKISPEDIENIFTQPTSISSTQIDPMVLPQMGPFGIVVFRVVYWTTDENGNRVKASGLVAFPDPDTLPPGMVPPLVSDQHGTIFLDVDAPTNDFMADIAAIQNGGEPTGVTFLKVILYSGLFGFAVSMPDYIGYGESVNHYHTYMLENSLANATVDLITASAELSEIMGIPLKKEVYLVGYSEGGYATMAAAKKMQSDNRGFTVKAVLPMGGVYNLELMGLGLINGETLAFPPFPAYVVYAYSEAYPDVQLEGMVNESFVTGLAPLFDKTKDGLTIYGIMFNMVGKDPNNDVFNVSDLFTQTAIESFNTDENYPFRARLRENNVDDWIPDVYMQIVHCSGDDILPVGLAENTYQKFSEAGAPVVFVDLGDFSHTDCGEQAFYYSLFMLCNLEYGDVCAF